MNKRNKHIGSSLEDVLKEEGVLEQTPCGRAERDAGRASAASDEEGENQQGRDGAAHEDKPRGA